MRKQKWTYYTIFCTWLAWLCCGCSVEEELVTPTPEDFSPIKLKVSFNLDKDALQGNLRTTTNEYGATTNESAINSLTLFITNVKKGIETLETKKTIQKPNIENTQIFEFDVEKGWKRFYLIANLEGKTINEHNTFTGDASEYILQESDLTVHYSNTDQLMTIDEITGAGSNILMTARITNGNDQDIKVETGEIMIDTPVKLERVVSKVLLTCKTDLNNYIPVKNNAGWAQLANVRYMGNLFNRKVYLFPQTVETLGLKDGNFEMSPFFEKDPKGNYIIKDKEGDYKNNFQFYDNYQEVERLKTDCKAYHKAVKYDENRLDPASENLYTEGMYFMENRVKNDFTDIPSMISYTPDETFTIVSQLVSTHLLVAVKFVPKTIRYDNMGSLENYTAPDESTMLTKHLTNQTENLTGKDITYEAGTFWYYNGIYFTLDAMKHFLALPENANVSRAEMERFDGGWGYYFTFIGANNGSVRSTDSAWGLSRNHYYILNVNQLIPPGSSIPGNKTIIIPTLELEWIPKGGSDIIIQ